MGISKWRMKAALARTTGAAATAAPHLLLVGNNSIIEGEPVLAERQGALVPDLLGAQAYGHNFKFSSEGLEPHAHALGYTLWLILGAQVAATDTHTITPANTIEYLEFFLDNVTDLGTSTPTETLLGGKLEKWELECGAQKFAKLAIGGPACAKGSPAATLALSIPSGAANAPLSWAAIRAATGGFKIGYNGAAVAADTGVTGFKVSIARTITPQPIDLSGDQPSAMNEGGREITFEFTREFAGSGALNAYNAWSGNQLVGVEINATMGTNTFKLEIPKMYITGSFKEGGTSGDDILMGTLKCKAALPDAAAIITATVKDGVSGDYT